MTASTIVVSGIKPNLDILGAYQEFKFDQNSSAFRLHNTVTPTTLLDTKTDFEFRNNVLSGYKFSHISTSDDNNDTPGTLKLQSFLNVDNSTNDLITFNPDGSISVFAPISIEYVNNNIDMQSNRILNLSDPVGDQDATTKSWVLSQISGDTDPVTLTGDVTGSGPTGSPIDTTIENCAVSALSGFPSDSSLFLRGDGTWTNTFTAGLVISGNVLNMSSQRIIGLSTPVNVDDAATRGYVDASVSGVPTTITLTGNVTGSGSAGSPISTTVAVCPPSAITGYPSNTTSFLRGDGSWSNALTNGLSISGSSLNMNSQKIVSLATPTASGDAVNKTYADGIPGSFNVSLSGAVSGSGVANTTISTVLSSTLSMQGNTQTFDFGTSRNQTKFYIKNNYSGDISSNPYDNRIGLTMASPVGPGFAFSHTYGASSSAYGEFHLLPLYSSTDGPNLLNIVYPTFTPPGYEESFVCEFNSTVKIGTNTQTTYPARLYVYNNSNLPTNTKLAGSQTATFSTSIGTISGSCQTGLDNTCNFSPSTQVTGAVFGSFLSPTITVPNVTDPAIANGFGQYVYVNVTGTAGKTLTNCYGMYVGSGSLSTASVTNAYGGYFANPGFGTTKMALYSDNLSIGITGTAPPTGGLSVNGESWFSSNIFMRNNMVSLKSSSDLSHGMVYNSSLDGTEFRGYAGYTWKTGLSGATSVMGLDAAGVLTLTGNSSSTVNASVRLKRYDTSSYGQVQFYTGSTNYMSLGMRAGGTNSLFIHDEANNIDVATFTPGAVPTISFNGSATFNNSSDNFFSLNSSGTKNSIVFKNSGTSKWEVYNYTTSSLFSIYNNTASSDFFTIDGNANVSLGSLGSFGGGRRIVFIPNCTLVPSSSPVGGGALVVQSGALYWKGSSGSLTLVAPA